MDKILEREIKEVKQQFNIVGNSTALDNAIERALKVAPYDLSVLIIGASGSGKEFFPQIIHKKSKRKNKKYTAINCGSMPEGTIDSELFGHVKGAFTGAEKDRKGYFGETDGGTIFLDEVAEMPLDTQARLLRVLQNGEYIKVGSDVVQKTNVRVVAATNKDLKKAVNEGKFREDLYYRLSTIQIDIPSLRERTDDIKLIARVFAHDFAETYNTQPIKLSEDALRVLSQYSWPGNVRQLKSLIESICLFEAGHEITGDIVKKHLPEDTVISTSVTTVNSNNNNINNMMLLKMLEIFNAEIEELKKKINEMENDKACNSIANTESAAVNINTLSESAAELSFSSKLQRKSLKMFDVTERYTPIKEHNFDKLINEEEMYDEMVGTDTEYAEVVGSDEDFKSLEEIEKEAIRNALIRNNGKRKITAEQLKISERTLYRKIEEYNLNL